MSNFETFLCLLALMAAIFGIGSLILSLFGYMGAFAFIATIYIVGALL